VAWLEASVDWSLFIDRLEGAPHVRRRLGGSGTRPPIVSRARANDRRRGAPPAPRIDLVLYTSGASERSQKALRKVQEVLERYDAAQVKFSTCDMSLRPQDGEADAIVFTPTLVKQGPGPRTAIIGNLEREDVLCELLDASGVERRRWNE
jgi:hypothetical protein